MPNPHFEAQLNADLESVFFRDFGEEVRVVDSEVLLKILFDQDVEVIDAEGTVDVVDHVISVRCHLVQRNETVFERGGKRWRVGRLLEQSPDGRLETWEVARDVRTT